MDFSLNSRVWPGAAKLAEESAEVIQVLAKLVGCGGGVSHWDGTDLRSRLEDEIGDLLAAAVYMIVMSRLDAVRILNRMERKLALFRTYE